MKIEDQVCSLELAKKINELLGDKAPESYWCWVKDRDSKIWYLCLIDTIGQSGRFYNPKLNHYWSFDCEHYPAYTVAELGEMLPDLAISLYDEEGYYYLQFSKIMTDCWDIDLIGDWSENLKYQARDKREANARAKMLIYLLENGLM